MPTPYTTDSADVPWTQAIAGSSQTIFSTNWTANVASDVLVYNRLPSAEANDVLQLVDSSLYTVQFVGATATVQVTFITAPAQYNIITIIRNTPSDFLNTYTNTNFTPSMLNGDFERVTLVAQQNDMKATQFAPHYNTSASVVLQNDIYATGGDEILPILGANQVWAKNADNTGIVAYDVPEGGGIAPSTATYLLQVADASLPDAQAMGALASGLVVNTNSTGVQLTRTIVGTSSQIGVTNGSGLSGDPTLYISDNPVLTGLEGLGLPTGTTAQRPVSPVGTDLRFNTTLNFLEYHDGSGWVQLSETDGVTTATGTEDQVLVNGTSGVATEGAITLTLPQSIATSSSPTFTGLSAGNLNLLANTLSSTNTNGVVFFQSNGTGQYVFGQANGVSPATGNNNLINTGSPATLSGNYYGFGYVNNNAAPVIVLYKSRSTTIGVNTVVQAGDYLGRVIFGADTGSAFSNRAIISSQATTIGSFVGSNLTFATSGTGSASNITAMTISDAQVVTLANALPIGSGGTGVTSTPTNGQLLIGNGTGYTLANLTAGAGVSISNGSGSITIAGTGSGIGWTEVTGTTQTMSADNGYVANNASQVVFTLPTTAAFGTALSIVGKGAGGWKIVFNSGQSIHLGNVQATVTTGSISSVQQRDSINLICTSADTTWTTQGAPQSAGLTYT